ncbi:hypothetical protein [Pseudomonas typographi]|uniref:hypothetical protein n=1 Tax=Pseudomonas typographi TaxID=2715964 RepID=UPI0016842142|nr:hypothetical protein [Pseudomonas typographi]MBD1555005.1 hypothetical protein [Pseudomonas typographi]
MTIYAGDAQTLDRRTMLDIPADSGEVAGAVFDKQLFETGSNAIRRMEELNQAEEGRRFTGDTESILVPPRLEPDTPLIDAAQATAQAKAAGFDLKIPAQGIRQGALDILIDRQREQAARQQVMARAASGTLPAQIAAGLGASLLDPLNIASAFVPVVGEARYASMLAGASGAFGRAGIRAGVGAAEGAVGAAILEPLPLMAAQQDQTEYGLSDSLANIAFGGVLGGGLHTFGGAAGDLLARRSERGIESDLADVREAFDAANSNFGIRASYPDYLGETQLTRPDDLMRISNAQEFASRVGRRAEFDDEGRATYSDGTAYGQEEILPFYRAHVEGKEKFAPAPDTLFQIGRIDADSAAMLKVFVKGFTGDATEVRINGAGIAHIRDSRPGIAEGMLARLADNVVRPEEVLPNPKNRDRALMVLNGAPTGSDRGKSGVTVLELASKDGVGLDVVTSMTVRPNAPLLREGRELAQAEGLHFPHSIGNESPHVAAADFPAFARAAEDVGSHTARARASAAPWYIRQDALRTAVAQSVSGRDVDVQNLFDLADPAKAPAAMDALRQPQARRLDPAGLAESRRVDEIPEAIDDIEEARAALAEDEANVKQLLDQLDPESRDAIEAIGREQDEASAAYAAKAQQYSKAYQAAAACELRNA